MEFTEEEKAAILRFLKDKLRFYEYAIPKNKQDIANEPYVAVRESYQRLLNKYETESALLTEYIQEVEAIETED